MVLQIILEYILGTLFERNTDLKRISWTHI
jgi:hypothetical protein